MRPGRFLGIAAAGVFLVTLFVFDVGVVGAAIISVLFFVGARAIVGARRRRVRHDQRGEAGIESGRGDASGDRVGSNASDAINIDLSGLNIDREEFQNALAEGARKLTTLKRAAERITDQRVRGKAYAVCDSVARILSDIREDPKDLRPARKFLGYYLDATIKVVDRYVTLSAKTVQTDEITALLRRVEESLDTIKAAYDKQLAQLLENDVIDLDTELDVLERTIRMEGLGEH